MSTYKYYEECIPHGNRSMLNEKIDFKNGGVDLHLGELGGVLENWKDIAPLLELDGIAIGDIEADHRLSRGEQRRACLRKWKSRKGFMATYGKLLDACLRTDNLKCADKIVMLLGATRPPSLNAHPPNGQSPQAYTNGNHPQTAPVFPPQPQPSTQATQQSYSQVQTGHDSQASHSQASHPPHFQSPHYQHAAQPFHSQPAVHQPQYAAMQPYPYPQQPPYPPPTSSQPMYFHGGVWYPYYPPPQTWGQQGNLPRDTPDGASAGTSNLGNTPPPKSTGLIADIQQFSQMYPKHSYLEAFNEVRPDMKNSIVGSVDGLCDKAIAKDLMTDEEKAGIFVDNDIYKQASRFLDGLAAKIEVDPPVLALLMNMLSGLGLRTCNQIVLRITQILDLKKKDATSN